MTPLALMAVAVVLGIVASPLVSVSWPLTVCGAVAMVALHLAATVQARRHLWPAFAALLAAFAIGLVAGARETRPEPAFKESEHVLVGEAVRLSRSAGHRWWLHMRLRGAAVVRKDGGPATLWPTSTEVSLIVDEPTALRVRLHDEVLVRVRGLTRRRRQNFGDLRRRPSAFGVLVAGPMVTRAGSPLDAALSEVRVFLRDRLRQSLDGAELGVALAMVLGDRTLLDDDVVATFRVTGTAHLLAVSGLHVTMVSLLFRWLVVVALARTPLARQYRVAAPASAVAVVACWCYALLTGLAPPAFRAAVMTSAALAADVAGRPARLGRAICLAAAALLVHDASLIWSPGFQLSFAAVIALSRLHHRRSTPGDTTSKVWDRLRTVAGAVRRAASSSLAASLATAPLVAHHFGLFSPIGVAVNVIAVPLMGLVLPGLLLITLVSAVHVDAGRAVSTVMATCCLGPSLAALRWLGTLWGASVAVARPGLVEALLLAAAGVAVARGSRAVRSVAVVMAVVAATSWVVRVNLRHLDDTMQVTFLDVGQGDSTLIELPDNRRLLIDSGPREGAAGRTIDVVASVQRGGFGALELFALTHGHVDHVSGAEAVLKDVGAERCWVPMDGLEAPTERTVSGAQLAVLASRHGAVVERPPSICGVHRLGRARLEVLHPCVPEARELSENDRSLVVRLVYGRVAFLLPGDVEQAGETMLLRRRRRLRATVLKLPHHGSNTSSSEALLEAVRPDVAVASCGASRRRVLPHPAVIGRLGRMGTLVLSTAELGAIRVTTDGRSIRVTSAREGLVPLR